MGNIAILVGARIKELRNKRKWTQEQLAEHADLNVSYVIALEKGRKNASLDVLYRISNAFQMPLTEFFDTTPAIAVEDSRSQNSRAREERIEQLVREFSQKLIREFEKDENC